MNELCQNLLAVLLRTTLFLSVATGFAMVLLAACRCRSPSLHRLVWCLVLFQGVLFVQLPVPVAWGPTLSGATARARGLPAADDSMALSAGTPGMADAAGPAVAAADVRQAARTDAAADPHGPWAMALVLVWLVGIVVIPGVWTFGYIRFVRALPVGLPAPDEWEQQWAELLSAIHPGSPMALRVTENLGPMLWRHGKGYTLFVPGSLWGGLSPAQRAAILRHELAHYQRGDLWKSLAARLLALPHWFNPCSWLAVRRFDEAAEWACDQLATGQSTAVAEYARALVAVCDQAGNHQPYAPSVCGSGVARRIRRLLLSHTLEDSSMKKILVCLVVGLLLSAAAVRVELVGQEVPLKRRVPKETQQAVVDAARQAYRAVADSYEAGTSPLEHVYGWSRRWAQAAAAAAESAEEHEAAYRDHRSRMKEMYERVEVLYKLGARGGGEPEYWAAKFYLAEAELWLSEALIKARP